MICMFKDVYVCDCPRTLECQKASIGLQQKQQSQEKLQVLSMCVTHWSFRDRPETMRQRSQQSQPSGSHSGPVKLLWTWPLGPHSQIWLQMPTKEEKKRHCPFHEQGRHKALDSHNCTEQGFLQQGKKRIIQTQHSPFQNGGGRCQKSPWICWNWPCLPLSTSSTSQLWWAYPRWGCGGSWQPQPGQSFLAKLKRGRIKIKSDVAW